MHYARSQIDCGARMDSNQTMFRALAEPIRRGEKIQVVIDRAARCVGMSYSRAFETWYGRSRLTESEVLRIVEALEVKKNQDARNELVELRTRLDALEYRLRQGDADFSGADIDPLRAAMCKRG